jgi:glycosyltransferase involved in cell wall biosynthesis
VKSENDKKTVIFVIDGLGIGGAERLMIPILACLNRERFEARVCVLQSKEGNPLAADIQALGVPVDSLDVKQLRDFTAISKLRKYLKQHKADIVHTQLEFSNILGNISARSMGLPGISTIHVLPVSDAGFKARLHQWVEWTALRLFCDRVVTVSEETRRHYIAQSGISPGKLFTIYNGIDLERFQRIEPYLAHASVRKEFALPDDAILLITVAVLRPPKGIQYMIRALPSIVARFPKAYYLVVGDGVHADALADEAMQNNVGEHVLFAGSRTDIAQLLSGSDIFILPTLTEALPTVLAEAMACHLPIIASAVGGVPEMVQTGENGILIPPADPEELSAACTQLLADHDLRMNMGEKGWLQVNEKFNVKRQVLQLQKQYLELINHYGK